MFPRRVDSSSFSLERSGICILDRHICSHICTAKDRMQSSPPASRLQLDNAMQYFFPAAAFQQVIACIFHCYDLSSSGSTSDGPCRRLALAAIELVAY